MINFASNFNYHGPPEGLEDLVGANLNAVLESYSHPHSGAIEEAVSQHFGVPEQCVANGAGSTELIFVMARYLPRRSALVVKPTFWEYGVANERAGNQAVEVELSSEDDFKLTPEALSEKLIEHDYNVYLCNPNNPTSTLSDTQELLSLVDNYPDSDFVIDETYLLFREDFSERSLAKFASKLPNLHVITSFSKFFSSPGIRAGTLISDPDTIERFRSMQIPYIVPPLAEVVLPWLLEQTDYIKSSRQQHSRKRLGTTALFREVLADKVTLFAPTANFIFGRVNIPRPESAADFLGKRGIAVRAGEEWGRDYQDYFRVCLRGDGDNKQLLSQLVDYTE